MLDTHWVTAFVSTARDRRRGHRFNLRLTCRVSSPEKRFPELDGVSSNISRSGLVVVLEGPGKPGALPKAGEQARILLDLPHSPNISPRCLECMTTVVRSMDTGKDQCSIAFEIHRIRVVDQSGRPAEETASLSRLPVPRSIQ